MSTGHAANGCAAAPAVQDSKRVKLSSAFTRVKAIPLDEVFLMKDLFLADQSPNKINLSVGGELCHLSVAVSVIE